MAAKADTVDKSLPFQIRRATDDDIYQIVTLISKEPRQNLKIIAKVVFYNIGIIILMFLSSIFAMLIPFLFNRYPEAGEKEIKPLSFLIYVGFGCLGALIAYGCALIQAFFLYGRRYSEMYSIIQCYKDMMLDKILRKEIEQFQKKYQFYVAVPNNDNKSKENNQES